MTASPTDGDAGDDARLVAARATPLALGSPNSAEIADATVTTWQAASAALVPVIGQLGFAALFVRCVHLSAEQFPWLAISGPAAPGRVDLEALRTAFARQRSERAADGARALQHHFTDLLTSLVGASLTERLLRSVWVTAARGESAHTGRP